jgi:hypothetical protein
LATEIATIQWPSIGAAGGSALAVAEPASIVAAAVSGNSSDLIP